jgi:paraquat-inducible protein A
MDLEDGLLRECPDCGLFQRLPALPRRTVARCPRCHAVLRRRRIDTVPRTLALAATGLLLFVLATRMDFLSLDYRGRDLRTYFTSGPLALEQFGMWEVSIVVVATTIAAPLLRLACLGWVMLGLRLRHPPAGLQVEFRWAEWLRAWSMIEVFLLGLFVAYTRISDMATVDLGGAVYALAGLMVAQVAADAAMDRETIWRQIAALRPPSVARVRPRGVPLGCDTCRMVSDAGPLCPRCGSRLRGRKPDSLARTAALLAAGAILYLPANLLPVLTLIYLGQGAPDTILGGVMQLADAGMWPLALLVFFASLTVPVLKLVGLTYLLLTTRRRSRRRLRLRMLVYRVVDSIGRWSMIDVFMISILTALVRFGTLSSAIPGPGVIAFCAVVILTMIAAQAFDPRLMWDSLAAEGGR